MVGAYGKNPKASHAGAADIFERDVAGAENWGQVKLTAGMRQHLMILASPWPSAAIRRWSVRGRRIVCRSRLHL